MILSLLFFGATCSLMRFPIALIALLSMNLETTDTHWSKVRGLMDWSRSFMKLAKMYLRNLR